MAWDLRRERIRSQSSTDGPGRRIQDSSHDGIGRDMALWNLDQETVDAFLEGCYVDGFAALGVWVVAGGDFGDSRVLGGHCEGEEWFEVNLG